MLVVKYSVPVAGMTSAWRAMPDRSSIVEPGGDRRVDPFVEVDLMAGVEEDAEERVAEVPIDDARQLAAGDADVERLVPLGDGVEVGRHEPLDVVLDAARQLGGVLDHEARATVEGAPDPKATVNRSPRSMARSVGLSRPSVARGPAVSIRWHESGVPLPAQQAHGLVLGHARRRRPRNRSRTPPDVWQAAHSKHAS